MIIQLPEIKQFCRVSGSDDDILLEGFAQTAEAMVLDHLRRDLNLEFPTGNWPAPCSTALLFLIGEMYDSRNAPPDAGDAVLPLRVRMLLAPYRDMS